MRRINISMIIMTAGALERVSPAFPKLSALAALLRSVCRVDEGYGNAVPFSPVSAGPDHHVIEPLTKFTVGTATVPTAFTNLLYTQILEDQDGVFRYPFTQLSRSFFTERLTTVRVSTTQPFQDTPNRAGILFKCLTVGQLFLKSLTDFTGFPVTYFMPLTGNKQRIVGSRCHQSICSPKINTHRDIPGGLRDFKGNTKANFAVPCNRNAIIRFSVVEVILGVGRDVIGEFSPSPKNGDAEQTAVLKEPAVSSIKKKGRGFSEDEGSLRRPAVTSGGGVGTYNGTYSRTFHLGTKLSGNVMIYGVMQIYCRKNVTIIESNRGYSPLITVIFFNQGFQSRSIVYDNWYGAFYFHINTIPLKDRAVKPCWKDF